MQDIIEVINRANDAGVGGSQRDLIQKAIKMLADELGDQAEDAGVARSDTAKMLKDDIMVALGLRQVTKEITTSNWKPTNTMVKAMTMIGQHRSEADDQDFSMRQILLNMWQAEWSKALTLSEIITRVELNRAIQFENLEKSVRRVLNRMVRKQLLRRRRYLGLSLWEINY